MGAAHREVADGRTCRGQGVSDEEIDGDGVTVQRGRRGRWRRLTAPPLGLEGVDDEDDDGAPPGRRLEAR